jgi:hypothetical protein
MPKIGLYFLAIDVVCSIPVFLGIEWSCFRYRYYQEELCKIEVRHILFKKIRFSIFLNNQPTVYYQQRTI